MSHLAGLVADLCAEQAALDTCLSHLAPGDWGRETPAVGWTIQDQVAHLAFFDAAATLACTDAEAFHRQLAEVGGEPSRVIDQQLGAGRALGAQQVLAWWRWARLELASALAEADPRRRVPWYGPTMSVASLVTARLMETWAHGQDVADPLGLEREPTARLQHVAHLGVRARPYSFAVRGLPIPTREVSVELVGPSGECWAWGDSHLPDRVVGPALDFCLVVTQRRHVADTALQITGEAARAWMAIAQAFAGPPGPGRSPGQFGPGPSRPDSRGPDHAESAGRGVSPPSTLSEREQRPCPA
jgi:uncharacterized protein (TIGR03084 family)